MAQKSMNRKELRKPDEFVAFSQRAWTFVRENRKAVIVGTSVTAVVVIAVSLWVHLAEQRAEQGTERLSAALEVYNQAIVPAEEAADAPPPKESPRPGARLC